MVINRRVKQLRIHFEFTLNEPRLLDTKFVFLL